MSGKAGEGNNAQPKMVPESTLIASRKRDADEKRSLKKQLAEAQAQLSSMGSLSKISTLTDESDLQAVRDELFKLNKEIAGKQAELESREEALKGTEREQEFQNIADRHGVPVEELSSFDSPEAAERHAMELRILAMGSEVAELKTASPNQGKFGDFGTPSATQKSVGDMDKEEFDAHYANLQKEAQARA